MVVPSDGQRLATSAARLAVSDENRDRDSSRGGGRQEVNAPLLVGLLELVAMVLKPYFHLGWRQTKYTGEVFAFRCRQVALKLEASLQLVGL